jgi:hypothetical protein
MQNPVASPPDPYQGPDVSAKERERHQLARRKHVPGVTYPAPNKHAIVTQSHISTIMRQVMGSTKEEYSHHPDRTSLGPEQERHLMRVPAKELVVQRSRKGDPDQVRREQHKGDIWKEAEARRPWPSVSDDRLGVTA